MDIRIINDVHLFGIDPTHKVEEVVRAILDSPYFVLLNGDNVDIANAWKKDLPEALLVAERLRTLTIRQGGMYLRGNHECDRIQAPDFAYIDDKKTIQATHSDIWCWGKERSEKFRSQDPGAGFIKRNLISKPIHFLRRFKEVRPNDRERAAIKLAKKENPALLVNLLAHNHPDHHVIFEESGTNNLIPMRGIHDFRIGSDGSITEIK